MIYAIQFAALLLSPLLVIALFLKLNKKIKLICVLGLCAYAFYILFFTGPVDLNSYPKENLYKLPWKAGVSRFVAQGNRSFVSHRDFHTYAWDFVMPNGTEILAARDGKVIEIEDSLDGVGYYSNYIVIEHEDGERSAYAHIQQNSSLVRIDDLVKQGQPIALSGMVGQTIFPHLHFYVIDKDGLSSTPVTFKEVQDGVPLAGRFYTSNNTLDSQQ